MNLPPSRTRRRSACTSMGISPISSRKSVPPSAWRKSPSVRSTAFVNAPLSCPKNRSSRRSFVTLAQLNGTNGILALGLLLWIWFATVSLPVPLSPRISTRARSHFATRLIRSCSVVITGLFPMSSRPP